MAELPRIPLSWFIELVNTHGTRPRVTAGETEKPYPELPAVEGVPSAPAVSQSELVAVADRLWPVFAAPAIEDKTRLFNDLAKRFALSPTIGTDAGVRWSIPSTDASEILTAAGVAALLDAITEHGWHSLGVCDGEDCADVYLDASNRHRRYCSATCLNRARVRAYRSRRRAERA
jgi:predicted RNA-binding Zn ribbon-like protein